MQSINVSQSFLFLFSDCKSITRRTLACRRTKVNFWKRVSACDSAAKPLLTLHNSAMLGKYPMNIFYYRIHSIYASPWIVRVAAASRLTHEFRIELPPKVKIKIVRARTIPVYTVVGLYIIWEIKVKKSYSTLRFLTLHNSASTLSKYSMNNWTFYQRKKHGCQLMLK